MKDENGGDGAKASKIARSRWKGLMGRICVAQSGNPDEEGKAWH